MLVVQRLAQQLLSYLLALRKFAQNIAPTFSVYRFLADLHRPRVKSRLMVSDLPDEILYEIFQFATYIPESESIVPLDPFLPKRVSANVMGPNTPTAVNRTKCTLVLVCSAWRRISMQLMYRHIYIRSPQRAELLLQLLRRDSDVPPFNTSEYGRFTRHIEVFTHARGSNNIHFFQTVFRIFQCCPNVRMLSGTWSDPLPNAFCEAVSQLYGSSLEGLYWDGGGGPFMPTSWGGPFVPTSFFASFRTLRALAIHKADLRNLPLDRHTLPLLQVLILTHSAENLRLASLLDLPMLRDLVYMSDAMSAYASQDVFRDFLSVHGPSLRSIDCVPLPLDNPHFTPLHKPTEAFLNPQHCPNLDTFTFDARSLPFNLPPNCPVRVIGLRGIQAGDLYPNKTSNGASHLKAFVGDACPYLETVRAVEFLVESDSDSFIKDIFIWWTEKFERRGVDFQDAEGVVWSYPDDDDDVDDVAEEIKLVAVGV
ncbi:hypothetical protein D9758_012882 [Tetrapyrgos nigripes]|uniref:F-box domain-containing protein n=1 Tax=Tetrapyrgos nigripes TaxID=182062 RepID=A0A8H5CNA1_9AGAR|nr:hypothetical protein D9758_012882 [Tetrapyrgos nigripes]